MYKFTYPAELWDERQLNKTLVRRLIDKHYSIQGPKKRNYQYYLGKHAIMERKRKDDAPNNQIVCNHAKDITDNASGYFMGSPITYAGAVDQDIDPLLTSFDKGDVDDVDADNAIDLSIFGLTYEYVYADRDGDPVSKALSPLNTFMVYDDSIEENELFGVYYWAKKNDADDRVFFVATVVTENLKYNFYLESKPEYKDAGVEKDDPYIYADEIPQNHYFGAIPIIEYLNNKEAIGDFEMQIPLIDAYNNLMSDRVNDKDQFIDSILALYGAILGDTTEETKEALETLKKEKLLELPIDAKAEYLTRQMDESGAETLRKALKEDIYTFSHVPNLTDENFAGQASGVALEYKLLGLEMLTKTKERHYRQGLKKRIRLYCNFLGLKQIAIDADSIVPTFSRALPKNLQELAGIVSMLQNRVSEKTLLNLLPFVEDPDGEIEAVEEQKEAAVQMQREAFDIRPNTPPELDEGDDSDEDEDMDSNNKKDPENRNQSVRK